MEKKSKLKINSLKLKNFRNYDLLNLELSEQTNIFYGDNAQGKTNTGIPVSVRHDQVVTGISKIKI